MQRLALKTKPHLLCPIPIVSTTSQRQVFGVMSAALAKREDVVELKSMPRSTKPPARQLKRETLKILQNQLKSQKPAVSAEANPPLLHSRTVWYERQTDISCNPSAT
jgi:hypothetical protein